MDDFLKHKIEVLQGEIFKEIISWIWVYCIVFPFGSKL